MDAGGRAAPPVVQGAARRQAGGARACARRRRRSGDRRGRAAASSSSRTSTSPLSRGRLHQGRRHRLLRARSRRCCCRTCEGRPLTLKRYPNGVDGEHFYEKNAPSHRPDWVQDRRGRAPGARRSTSSCARTSPTLVWLANLADLELHTSLSLAETIERPTMIAFDLDPGPPATIVECCQVALLAARDVRRARAAVLPEDVGLEGHAGLRAAQPRRRRLRQRHQAVREGGRRGARAAEEPGLVVSRLTKTLRKGKVLVDWSQNDEHKTTVCVYSLRARDAPDGLDAAEVGGGRGVPRSPATRTTSSSTRATCCGASRRRATCSRRCSRWCSGCRLCEGGSVALTGAVVSTPADDRSQARPLRASPARPRGLASAAAASRPCVARRGCRGVLARDPRPRSAMRRALRARTAPLHSGAGPDDERRDEMSALHGEGRLSPASMPGGRRLATDGRLGRCGSGSMSAVRRCALGTSPHVDLALRTCAADRPLGLLRAGHRDTASIARVCTLRRADRRASGGADPLREPASRRRRARRRWSPRRERRSHGRRQPRSTSSQPRCPRRSSRSRSAPGRRLPRRHRRPASRAVRGPAPTRSCTARSRRARTRSWLGRPSL